MIAHETGVASTADPLGGSYYVEALTNRLEEEAYAYFDRISEIGGVIPAIRENFFQQEIAEASFRFQSDVDSGERIVVGVNAYEEPEDESIDLLRIDPELERKQIAVVQALRARRETANVEAALARIKRDGTSDVNLMPALVAASKVRATVASVRCTARRLGPLARDTGLLGACPESGARPVAAANRRIEPSPTRPTPGSPRASPPPPHSGLTTRIPTTRPTAGSPPARLPDVGEAAGWDLFGVAGPVRIRVGVGAGAPTWLFA